MDVANGKYYLEVDLDLDLATRDFYLQKIENQIMAKRQMLLAKQKMLRKTSRQNHFLEEVQNDYSKYYNFIIKQKEEQIRSMNIIKQYLSDMIVSGKLTKEDIDEAKKEQRNILGEIGHIKGNLDEIMKETNTLDDQICPTKEKPINLGNKIQTM
jgi:hypothetical protein